MMANKATEHVSGSNEPLKEALLEASLDLFQQAHQQVWLPFVGASMLPYIREGDMILVQPTIRPIRFGDVIVFKQAGRLIAHRVVFIKKHGDTRIYRTKGDNLYSLDAPIPHSVVRGRIVCIQKEDSVINLEKPRIKLFSLLLALYSSTTGILYYALKKVRRKLTI